MPQAVRLPVIRVTKIPPGAKKQPPINKDVQLYDLILAVVESGNRTRNRVDGVEARMKYLEALLESRGGR